MSWAKLPLSREVQKVRDVGAVFVPAGRGRGDRSVVAGFGRRQDLRRDQDVLGEQPGELVAACFCVEGSQRVADVDLILEQAFSGDTRVGQVMRDADDEAACPDDVVLVQPQLVTRLPHEQPSP